MPPQALLICCVYPKLPEPAAARDLYLGPLFTRSSRYADSQTAPWFILSGEHGLVRPTDWLAPYDTDLHDTPADYRRAWGGWVVAKLDRELGGLAGATIEIHAPAGYVEPLRTPLTTAGAELRLPLADTDYQDWPAWYDHRLSGYGVSGETDESGR